MSVENNRHYRSLELHKILALLAEEASCADAKTIALDLTPETSLELAQGLVNQTVDANMLLARFGGPSFGGLKNVNVPIRRAVSGGIAGMRELLDIAEALRVIRSLSEWRQRCSGVKTCIDVYFDSLTPNKYLEEKITGAIISEEEMADTASPELYDIRRKIRQAASKVRDQLDKMIRSVHYQKYLQDSIITMRGDRFVVPVKSEYRNEVAGLVHDTSSSGATVFIEPMGVVEANNEIKVLKSKEEAEIERILYMLSAETGEFGESIIAGYECAVEINFIFAKAKLAGNMKASAPILNRDGITDLKKARHPLIDAQKVVPVDIRLGKDFDTLMITGPNTGGKTVSIKTLGLLTLMAMCGLMIPAAEQSRVSVYDHVLADIGDEQSIEQSLSTFSAHMTNIIEIMKRADGRSLVLLDELGAGTDPIEGAALAMAILEALRGKGAKIAATTHYAELKAYALNTAGVENGACEFDVSTLRPTYRLLIGVPGRSNAFAISERLGMESCVVERARELLSTESMRFEDVVEKLEISRKNMEQAHTEAERLHAEARQDREEVRRHKEQIENLREKELEKARGEAKRVVERAKREAEALMMELEILRKQKNTENIAELAARAKSQIKSRIDTLEDSADPVTYLPEEEYVLPRDLRIGDAVLVANLNKNGVVTGISHKSGAVEVQVGLMKMKVGKKNLRLLESAKREIPKTRTVTKSISRAEAEVKLKLDLRGKMVDEALPEVDAFIDSALISGVRDLTIVHGKGTGALRSAVQQHLRRHPAVRVFRLGVYGEGENGVTIVELK